MIPAIFFSVDIQHALDLSATMRRHGVRVYAVSGKTPKDERKRLVDMARAGDVDGLASCDALCLDSQTEILTDHGWTAMEEMTHSHRVANWDNGYVYFQEPVNIVRRPRMPNERMVSLRCQDFDVRVTENHRMLYRTWRVTNAAFLEVAAEHLVGRKVQVPVSGRLEKDSGLDVKVLQEIRTGRSRLLASQSFTLRKQGMDYQSAKEEANRRVDRRLSLRFREPRELTLDECRFIGFWLGDGSRFPKSHGGVGYSLCQSTRYPHIISWIRNTLRAIGLDFIERPHPAPKGEKKALPYIVWELSRGTGGGPQERRGLYHLEPYLKKHGSQLWWGWSHKQFDAFLEGLWLADGDHGQGLHTRRRSIQINGTAHRKCLDMVQAIAACHGYYTNLKLPIDGRTTRKLCLKKCSQVTLGVAHPLQFEPGWKEEEVWCVTSDSGFIITRRFGKVLVTGNSTGTDIPLAMMAVHARPTASGLWYRQATGRVLRPVPAPQGDRPYQRQALIAIYRALQRGVLNQVITLPTGTGKTTIAAKSLPMLRAWKDWGRQPFRGRLLFTVHRDELAFQAAETFSRLNQDLRVGIEKADSHACDSDIVIASIQTIGQKDGKRLEAIRPDQFDCEISDECHYGISSALYERVYRHMRVWKKSENRDSGILHLGMTATPNRSDNVGLEKHYDEITYNLALPDSIRDKWLCRILGYRAETKVDLSKLRMRSDGEDFALQELERTVNTPERNEMIAEKYLEICQEQRMDVQGWTPPSGWIKPHAIVLDCADLSGQHSLISAPTLFGFPAHFNAKGNDLMAQADRAKEIKKKNPNLDLRDAPDMDAIDATLRSVDLLAPPVVPPEVRGISGYAWLPDGPGAYHLGCMDHRVLTVRQNMLGQWEIHEHVKGMAQQIGSSKELRSALRLAEKSIPPKDKSILPVEARWRSEEPTEHQTKAAWDLDIRIRREHPDPQEYYRFVRGRHRAGDPRYTKGQMSQLLCALDPAIR